MATTPFLTRSEDRPHFTRHTIATALVRLAGRAMLLLGVAYVSVRAGNYLWQSPQEFAFAAQRAVYASHPLTLFVHIGAGVTALVVGAWQLTARGRGRCHRYLGQLYLGAVALAGTAALLAAPISYGSRANALAFTLMSVAWLLTTALAWYAIRQGQVSSHRRWMLRSYAVTLAAVTLRAELGLLIGVFGLSFDQAYAIVPWSSWMGNLLVLEGWMALRDRGHPTLAARHRPPAPARQRGSGRRGQRDALHGDPGGDRRAQPAGPGHRPAGAGMRHQ